VEINRDLVQGLKAALSQLREKERLFIKATTLQEQIEKSRVEMDDLENRIEEIKESKEDLKERRAEALRNALLPLAEAITSLLPRGQAVLTLEEHLFIGWRDGTRTTPYQGLSGGEKVFYDAALSHALLRGGGEKILIVEAAELDEKNLFATLQAISSAHPEAQVMVTTCHAPGGKMPEGWKVVTLP
jgi:hypothetical protein